MENKEDKPDFEKTLRKLLASNGWEVDDIVTLFESQLSSLTEAWKKDHDKLQVERLKVEKLNIDLTEENKLLKESMSVSITTHVNEEISRLTEENKRLRETLSDCVSTFNKLGYTETAKEIESLSKG